MNDRRNDNRKIASMLERIADLLEIKEVNPFRVRAYRRAADRLRSLNQSVRDLYLEEGLEGLKDLSGIGEALGRTIEEMLETGRSSQLDRLQGEISPEELFKQVPGIGSELAARLVSELGIQTLEELEMAAHDGRLRSVEGFGQQKVENVRVSLTGMLSPSAAREATDRQQENGGDVEMPPIGLLLDLDQKYRRKAGGGELRQIAPKRFNPEDEAWLPIMNVEEGGWSFTVLFSNTKRAHDLGKTHDWVVIYYERNGYEDQVTVVTETSGALEGKRVVRGHERGCMEYYEGRDN